MTAPLFQTLAQMKESLRLSGVPDDTANFNSAKILNDAILGARVEFYRRLGDTRVNEIVAYSHVAEPTSNPGVMRACAEGLEVKVVLLKLLPRLRLFFLESTGSSEDAYQREGVLRDMTQETLQERILLLQNEINDDFSFLIGDTDLGEQVTIHATTFEPDETPPRPGESVFGDPTIELMRLT